MITKPISEMPVEMRKSIDKFFFANSHLPTREYLELFHETFRCRTNEIDFGEWEMIFEEADYTWFVLKWG